MMKITENKRVQRAGLTMSTLLTGAKLLLEIRKMNRAFDKEDAYIAKARDQRALALRSGKRVDKKWAKHTEELRKYEVLDSAIKAEVTAARYAKALAALAKVEAGCESPA